MIGTIITKIRNDENLTKTKLSEMTDINIGHITHIEKGERNPSHKSLKSICNALDVPYHPLLLTYDKQISDVHHQYKIQNHINYNKIVAFNSFNDLIDCPKECKDASFAVKIEDDSMEPTLKKDSFLFIEENTPLNSRDVGIFKLDNRILIRRFIIKKEGLVLRPDNKDYEEIILSKNDNFCIIGKVVITK